MDFDALPALTPEYFFSFFGPVLEFLGQKPTSERFLKDWNEHILPQQEFARIQARNGQRVHVQTQGRPPTVFPMIEKISIPKDLVRAKALLITPALSDVPLHMFPKKRSTKVKDQYGHTSSFYFSPLVVVFGPQLRLTMLKKYDFKNEEKEVTELLTKQYDKKLKQEIAKRQATTELTARASSPGITFENCGDTDSDDSDDDDDDVNEEPPAKRPCERKKKKPVAVAPSSSAELGVEFIEEPERPFHHVHTFVRDKNLFFHIMRLMQDNGNTNVVTVSSVF